MGSRRESDSRPYVHVLLLTNADTGRHVCISSMWFTTFEETDRGTVFKFTNGEVVTVEESFREVTSALQRDFL